MSILKSVSFSTLQTFNHLLTELEREGLFNLAEARVLVAKETALHTQSRRRQLTKKQEPPHPQPCPVCGQLMTIVTADGEVIAACRNCRYSFLVEM